MPNTIPRRYAAMRILHRSALMLMFCAAVFAQTPTAQITGRIVVPSCAVIPFNEITVVNTDTGLLQKTVSNETGYFTVSLLPPGEYRISVQKQGFRAASRSGLTLVVDQVARLDFQLEIGNVTDSV